MCSNRDLFVFFESVLVIRASKALELDIHSVSGAAGQET